MFALAGNPDDQNARPLTWPAPRAQVAAAARELMMESTRARMKRPLVWVRGWHPGQIAMFWLVLVALLAWLRIESD